MKKRIYVKIRAVRGVYMEICKKENTFLEKCNTFIGNNNTFSARRIRFWREGVLEFGLFNLGNWQITSVFCMKVWPMRELLCRSCRGVSL